MRGRSPGGAGRLETCERVCSHTARGPQQHPGVGGWWFSDAAGGRQPQAGGGARSALWSIGAVVCNRSGPGNGVWMAPAL
eukprot:213452-Chlamydomonas_euryale.AAC.13